MSPAAGKLRLSKHEGAGNDFLVLLDVDEVVSLSEAQVVALCDRHRGIGADGLITVGPGRGGSELSMVLRNADGHEAEMSGNGMRCLAQAAFEGGLVVSPSFRVDTKAGVKAVEYRPGDVSGVGSADVDMGPARIMKELVRPSGERSVTVDVGNPHVVILVDDLENVDIAVDGPNVEAEFPGGINVEFIESTGRNALSLVVWERGAGVTLACGTGSIASAAAARHWGLVGDTVRVENPGGPLEVRLGQRIDDPTFLAGPVRRIAGVEVDLGTFP